MPVNPSLQRDPLNSPTERANNINDPQFENQQGYFGYDLTHGEYITPRFGELTPSFHLDTVPGDRHAVHDNIKTVLNQINGNFMSTLNQYVDSFYVPLRACLPNNYEKLIPNPTKGDDLPQSALPIVPLLGLFREYLFGSGSSTNFSDPEDIIFSLNELRTAFEDSLSTGYGDILVSNSSATVYFNRVLFLSYVLSRGQLLDYLGFQYDVVSSRANDLQRSIDDFFSEFHRAVLGAEGSWCYLYGHKLDPGSDVIGPISSTYEVYTLSQFRNAIASIFERGEIIEFDPAYLQELEGCPALSRLFDLYITLFEYDVQLHSISDIDQSTDLRSMGCFNITKVLAYQLCVAHYYTNDSIDNIFTADLFMQNLRAIMYPATGNFSKEPIFTYNGVQTEYDYMSYGGFFYSLLSVSTLNGLLHRQHLWMSVMLLMRRSLRYGDKFATARPRMLAVGQLEIAVENSTISPIDVTKNLLAQRYLNAANYIGSGFLQFYASMYGVVPSDTGVIPRFLAHRKIELANNIVSNTANNQGYQTTNLVGYSDNQAFDVFIDDFGFIISVVSYDVLPVYTSGIDACYHLADRFDYFNPMMQNIGDQPLFLSEQFGNIQTVNKVFGYDMRNSELKYKVSRAHGAFCTALPGFLLKYPYHDFVDGESDTINLRINPDFIRDKPYYLDSVVPQMTGISPGTYFHFVCACLNQVHSARKIQATPSTLF